MAFSSGLRCLSGRSFSASLRSAVACAPVKAVSWPYCAMSGPWLQPSSGVYGTSAAASPVGLAPLSAFSEDAFGNVHTASPASRSAPFTVTTVYPTAPTTARLSSTIPATAATRPPRTGFLMTSGGNSSEPPTSSGFSVVTVAPSAAWPDP